MDMPIQSEEHIRRKARKAFEDGELMKDCPYHWSAPAGRIWKAEYHRMEIEAQLHRASVSMAQRAAA